MSAGDGCTAIVALRKEPSDDFGPVDPLGLPGGVGNTHKDPEAFARLIHDVETKIFDVLPDETWVYPGHGDDTTLGAERPHLPQWHARGW